jgi:hypothetical protein
VTTEDHGWRSGAGAAVAVAAGDPTSWLFALAGFLARGGWLLVVLPILTIPSPVLLSMLFRGEVGAIGRGELRVVAVAVGAVLSLVAVAGVVVSAWTDVALAERFLRDTESEELRGGALPLDFTRAERRSLVWWVASVQAVALLPLIVAIAILVNAAVRAVSAELIDPSSTSVPLIARVLPQLAVPITVAIVVLVLVEALSSLASRRLMADAWAVLPGGQLAAKESVVALGALPRVVRAPGRVLLTAIVGWLVIGLTLAITSLATIVAWGSAREVLVSGGISGDPVGLAVGAVLIALFAAVWLGGLGLLGFATALRSGLWTADALR